MYQQADGDFVIDFEIDFEPEKQEISENDWNEMFKKGHFKKQDLDMLVMDFLVNREHPLVAEAFHKEAGCPLGIKDLSLLGTQSIVRDLIFNRRFDEVISLLNEKLGLNFLKDRPQIYFKLEQQKMIEMCRNHEFEAVLAFSRKFVMWENILDLKKECRRTLLLMMYGNNLDSPADDLLLFNRVFVIETDVVDEMIKFQGRETGNLIERAMKMLKSHQRNLNQVINFPNFNITSGYPQPLPHEHRF